MPPDRAGFVPGEAGERIAADAQQLEALLREITATVRVTDATPVAEPPDREELLREPLCGAPPAWAGLDLVLFLRSEGDVERIAIVDPASSKLAGLPVN
jgi:hypothetical protein